MMAGVFLVCVYASSDSTLRYLLSAGDSEFFLPSFAVACVARVDVMEAQLSACSVRCKAALSQYFVYR